MVKRLSFLLYAVSCKLNEQLAWLVGMRLIIAFLLNMKDFIIIRESKVNFLPKFMLKNISKNSEVVVRNKGTVPSIGNEENELRSGY